MGKGAVEENIPLIKKKKKCVEICKNIPFKKSLSGSFLSFRVEAIIYKRKNMQVLMRPLWYRVIYQVHIGDGVRKEAEKKNKSKQQKNNFKLRKMFSFGIWECVC